MNKKIETKNAYRKTSSVNAQLMHEPRQSMFTNNIITKQKNMTSFQQNYEIMVFNVLWINGTLNNVDHAYKYDDDIKEW